MLPVRNVLRSVAKTLTPPIQIQDADSILTAERQTMTLRAAVGLPSHGQIVAAFLGSSGRDAVTATIFANQRSTNTCN
jgi:hypothetical protein